MKRKRCLINKNKMMKTIKKNHLVVGIHHYTSSINIYCIKSRPMELLFLCLLSAIGRAFNEEMIHHPDMMKQLFGEEAPSPDNAWIKMAIVSHVTILSICYNNVTSAPSPTLNPSLCPSSSSSNLPSNLLHPFPFPTP